MGIKLCLERMYLLLFGEFQSEIFYCLIFVAICLRFSETNLILGNWFCWLDYVTLLFGFENITPPPPNKILFYPYRSWQTFFLRPGVKSDIGLTSVLLNGLLLSFIFLWKNENMVPSLLPRRLANSSFCSRCCGVMRHALYSRRLSKKLSLLSISRKDHTRDLNFAKQSLSLQLLMLTPTHNVISQNWCLLFSPLLPPQICGTAYKMYLNNVLLKMGQGPYVFMIFPTTCHHVFASS